MVQIEGVEDVVGCHVQGAPAVAWGRAVEVQGCVARGHGNGPCVVRRVCRVMPSQVVPEAVCEVPDKAGLAGAGGCGWDRGLRVVVRVELPAVGAAGEAVCGP